MIIPVLLAILRKIHFICSSLFSLLSIITPQNFALSTSRILDPFTWMVGLCSFLPLGLKIMQFVLSILRDNRFAFSHFIMLPSALLMTVDNSCKFSICRTMQCHQQIKLKRWPVKQKRYHLCIIEIIMGPVLSLMGQHRLSVLHRMRYYCNLQIGAF